jgi:hypothetical protein
MTIEDLYFHTNSHFVDSEHCENCGGNPIECDPNISCEDLLEIEVKKHLVDVLYTKKKKAEK